MLNHVFLVKTNKTAWSLLACHQNLWNKIQSELHYNSTVVDMMLLKNGKGPVHMHTKCHFCDGKAQIYIKNKFKREEKEAMKWVYADALWHFYIVESVPRILLQSPSHTSISSSSFTDTTSPSFEISFTPRYTLNRPILVAFAFYFQ